MESKLRLAVSTFRPVHPYFTDCSSWCARPDIPGPDIFDTTRETNEHQSINCARFATDRVRMHLLLLCCSSRSVLH